MNYPTENSIHARNLWKCKVLVLGVPGFPDGTLCFECSFLSAWLLCKSHSNRLCSVICFDDLTVVK